MGIWTSKIVCLVAGVVQCAQLLPRKYVFGEYSALPLIGKYVVGANAPVVQKRAAGSGENSYVQAVFLGLARGTEIVEISSERKIARNVIAVPILRPDVVVAIEHAFAVSRGSKSVVTPSSVVTDRDGGCFDQLRYIFAQGLELGEKEKLDQLLGRRSRRPGTNIAANGISSIVAKKMVETSDSLIKRSPNTSVYASFEESLKLVLGVNLLGVMLEVADRPSDKQLYVGGALLLGTGLDGLDASFTSSTALSLIRETQARLLRGGSNGQGEDGDGELLFLKCHSDEALGFSLACKKPVVVSKAISDQLEIDVMLSQNLNDGEVDCVGPYLTRAEKQALNRPSTGRLQSTERSQSQTLTPSMPNFQPEVDASTFLRMSSGQRREWLRSQLGGGSNSAIPRPREGLIVLNSACYNIMSVDVVYEVLRRLAECGGDEVAAAKMDDFQSLKPALARDIRLAQERNDSEKAAELIRKLNAMSLLNYNPFKPLAGPVDFNVDEWLYENRVVKVG